MRATRNLAFLWALLFACTPHTQAFFANASDQSLTVSVHLEKAVYQGAPEPQCPPEIQIVVAAASNLGEFARPRPLGADQFDRERCTATIVLPAGQAFALGAAPPMMALLLRSLTVSVSSGGDSSVIDRSNFMFQQEQHGDAFGSAHLLVWRYPRTRGAA